MKDMGLYCIFLLLSAQVLSVRGSRCDPGWRRFPKGCYKLSSNSTSWARALSACRDGERGSLLRHSQIKYLRAFLRNTQVQKVHLENNSNATTKQNTDDSDCSAIDRYGEISIIDCVNDNLFSICTSEALKEADFSNNKEPCPKNFVSFESSCYFLSQEAVNNVDAIKACESLHPLGTYLAIIRNEREDQFVKDLIKDSRVFFGLTHLDGEYIWPDGSVLGSHDYTNWRHGEPSSATTDKEPCTEYWGPSWNDLGCRFAKRYLCQVEQYKQPEANCNFDDGIPWVNDEASSMCYAVLNKERNWEGAAASCKVLGEDASLLSLGNPHQENYIKKVFQKNGHKGTYWVGMRKEGRNLFWNDNRPVSYMNWKGELPDSGCATMSLHEGEEDHWKFIDCRISIFPAICERRAKNYVETPLPSANDCPIGWKRSGTHCYYFTKMNKAYSEAEAFCKGLHSHATLAVIKHKENNEFIQGNILDPVYIGLNDIKTEGSYIWSDGTKLEDNSFSDWSSGKPHDPSHTHNCVKIVVSSGVDRNGWEATSCDETHHFVCSMDYSVCPYGSTLLNHRCFHTSSKEATCNEAEEYCQKTLHSGHLASIRGFDENEQLRENLHNESMWIGLKKAKGVTTYDKWIDGSKIQYTNFAPGEGIDEENVCEIMDMEGLWFPKAENSKHSIACTSKASAYMRCKIGWVKSETSCYLLGREKVDYKQAKESCKEKKGYLVQIESKAEMDFIEATYSFEAEGEYAANGENFWIGLNSRKGTRHYVWEDGSELRVDNWKGDSLHEEDECVWTEKERLWGTTSCDSKAFYLCESPQEIDRLPSPSHNGCKESQMAFQGFCYEFVHRLSSHQESKDFCHRQNSELLVVNTKEIDNRIISYIASKKDDVHLSLKFNKETSGWEWGDGVALEYNNWAIEEPNMDIPNEEGLCAVMISHGEFFGQWKAISCTERKNIICQSTRKGWTTPEPTTTTTTTLGPEFKCPENFYLHGSRCYYDSLAHLGNAGIKSFDDAEADCAKYGARLAVFESLEAQQDALQYEGYYGHFIGIRYIPSLNRFISVDSDVPFGGYEDWYEAQPDLSFSKYCVQVIKHWETIDCGVESDYVCAVAPSKEPFTTKAPVTTVPEDPCDKDPNGWFIIKALDSTTCYKIGAKDSLQSWFEARQICLSEGGDLVSIHNQNTNDYIWAKLDELEYEKNVWIGLNNLYPDSVHRWSDGSVYGYSNWAEGEPNDHISMEGCAEIYTARFGVWNDRHCQIKNNYVCSKPRYGSYPTPKPTLAPKGHCPSGVPEFEGHCYTLVGEQKLSWKDANQKCVEMGSKSVSIHSEREMAFLISMIFPLEEDDDNPTIWSGGNDIFKKGTYHWFDQTSFDFANWAKHEPDDRLDQFGNGFDCVGMDRKTDFELGQWFMKSCDDELSFICKSLVDPSVTELTYTLPACESNPSFGQYLDSCYLYVNQDKSWREAKDHCESLDSTLVSIHDRLHNSFVLSQSLTHVWLGLSSTDKHHSDVLLWTDDSNYNYHNFEENATFTSQSCVYMDWTSSLWKIGSCDSRRHFMCQIRNDLIPSGGTCPQVSGWEIGPLDHCYMFKNEKDSVDYDRALVGCEDHGGFLAGIHSQRDNDWIHKKMKHQASQNSWIGAYQVPESSGSPTFEWVDMEPFLGGYVNWETRNLGNATSYGAFNSTSGKWILLSTQEKLKNYLCSVQKVIPSQPPHLTTTSDPSGSSSTFPTPESSEGSNAGVTAGIVISSLLGLTLLGAVLFFSFRHRIPSLFFQTRPFNPISFSNLIYWKGSPTGPPEESSSGTSSNPLEIDSNLDE